MAVLDSKVESIFATIDEAQRLTSVEELERLMGQAFGAFGFDSHLLATTRDPGGVPVARVHFGSVNPTYTSAYAELRLYERDAIMRRALEKDQIFFSWSDVIAQADVREGEERLFDLAYQCGLADGYITPAHNLDGSATAVQLLTRHRLKLDPSERRAVHMLSLYFGLYGRDLTRNAKGLLVKPPIVLTNRQRECLQWKRAGKTIWETSVILGISQDTVKEHLDAARRKLGVNTNTQAVIEAVARGLIHI